MTMTMSTTMTPASSPPQRHSRSLSLLSLLSLSLSLLPTTASQAISSQPNPCQRWAQQTALVPTSSDSNDHTLYIFGGRIRTFPDQQANTWTNALLSLDLSTSWAAGSPPITQLIADNSGGTTAGTPPAVALGALWTSGDSSTLYQYGGHFSDTPEVAPATDQVWAYDISGRSWSALTTQNNPARSAEGAGAVVPAAAGAGGNFGYYFGGHLDAFSVNGWSINTARVYLNSMVRLDLDNREWYNYTSYATTGSSGSGNSTAEPAPIYRADFTLTFVPKIGTDNKGILVAIGGGNDQRMIDMNTLDVFDIGAGGWTKQSTSGDIPPPRVNHCAVRASAPVNEDMRHQVFIYGGQNANQTQQYGDIYVLDIPSYSWTRIGDRLPGAPTPRAGHTCDLIGSQMVVVGGYISQDILCDQPGIYVYDVSESTWLQNFTPGTKYSTPAALEAVIGGSGTAANGGTTGTDIPAGTGWGTGGGGSGGGGSGGGSGGGTGSGGGNGVQDNSGGGSSSNAGAIAGGVVGGLVLLALLGALIFILGRRRGYRERRESLGPFARWSAFNHRGSTSSSNESNPNPSPNHPSHNRSPSGAPFLPAAGAYGSHSPNPNDNSASTHSGTPAGGAPAAGSGRPGTGDRSQSSHNSHAPEMSQAYGSGAGRAPMGMRVGSGDSASGWGWHPASDDPENETRDMEAMAGSHFVPRRALRVVNAEDRD